MKIAFFSDIHIGVHKNDPDWYKIALKWCIWFKQQLIEQKIDRVVKAVVESRPDWNWLEFNRAYSVNAL